MPSEIYPNSPLSEVVFQIAFPGEMAIECQRHLLYEAVRDTFPMILVPNTQIGVSAALQPYKFEKSDKSAGIMIALNSFSYYQRSYKGSEVFEKELFEYIGIFKKLFPIKSLSRTGLRYINVIPFIREDGNINLNRFIKFDSGTPELSSPNKRIQYVAEKSYRQGNLIIRIENGESENREVLLLDMDYYKKEGLKKSQIRKYYQESHDALHELFESLIDENYRQYLRGEVL